MFHPCDAATILASHPPTRNGLNDGLLWTPSKTGKFSVKSACGNIESLVPNHQTTTLNHPPSGGGPSHPRLLLFGWRVFFKSLPSLPTADHLRRRNIPSNGLCLLCSQPETCLHLILYCPLTRSLLHHLIGIHSHLLAPQSPMNLLLWLHHPPSSWPTVSPQTINTLLIIWSTVRQTRNNTLFGRNPPCSPSHLLNNITALSMIYPAATPPPSPTTVQSQAALVRPPTGHHYILITHGL